MAPWRISYMWYQVFLKGKSHFTQWTATGQCRPESFFSRPRDRSTLYSAAFLYYARGNGYPRIPLLRQANAVASDTWDPV